jgi:hypothetical protein
LCVCDRAGEKKIVGGCGFARRKGQNRIFIFGKTKWMCTGVHGCAAAAETTVDAGLPDANFS